MVKPVGYSWGAFQSGEIILNLLFSFFVPTVSQVCCHDFLRPFEYTMTHNANPEIRDMVGFHNTLVVGESA
jgi:hypothetical protein